MVGCVNLRMKEVEMVEADDINKDDRPAWARTPPNTVIHEDDSIVIIHAQGPYNDCEAQAGVVIFEMNMAKAMDSIVDPTNVIGRRTVFYVPGGPIIEEERCYWEQCVSCRVMFLK
jgi:hypothetical protein